MRQPLFALIVFMLLGLGCLMPPLVSQAQVQGGVSVFQGASVGQAPLVILRRLLAANQLNPQLVTTIDIQQSDALNAYTNGQSIVDHRYLAGPDQRRYASLCDWT
jgi:hypothetical protein